MAGSGARRVQGVRRGNVAGSGWGEKGWEGGGGAGSGVGAVEE